MNRGFALVLAVTIWFIASNSIAQMKYPYKVYIATNTSDTQLDGKLM